MPGFWAKYLDKQRVPFWAFYEVGTDGTVNPIAVKVTREERTTITSPLNINTPSTRSQKGNLAKGYFRRTRNNRLQPLRNYTGSVAQFTTEGNSTLTRNDLVVPYDRLERLNRGPGKISDGEVEMAETLSANEMQRLATERAHIQAETASPSYTSLGLRERAAGTVAAPLVGFLARVVDNITGARDREVDARLAGADLEAQKQHVEAQRRAEEATRAAALARAAAEEAEQAAAAAAAANRADSNQRTAAAEETTRRAAEEATRRAAEAAAAAQAAAAEAASWGGARGRIAQAAAAARAAVGGAAGSAAAAAQAVLSSAVAGAQALGTELNPFSAPQGPAAQESDTHMGEMRRGMPYTLAALSPLALTQRFGQGFTTGQLVSRYAGNLGAPIVAALRSDSVTQSAIIETGREYDITPVTGTVARIKFAVNEAGALGVSEIKFDPSALVNKVATLSESARKALVMFGKLTGAVTFVALVLSGQAAAVAVGAPLALLAATGAFIGPRLVGSTAALFNSFVENIGTPTVQAAMAAGGVVYAAGSAGVAKTVGSPEQRRANTQKLTQQKTLWAGIARNMAAVEKKIDEYAQNTLDDIRRAARGGGRSAFGVVQRNAAATKETALRNFDQRLGQGGEQSYASLIRTLNTDLSRVLNEYLQDPTVVAQNLPEAAAAAADAGSGGAAAAGAAAGAAAANAAAGAAAAAVVNAPANAAAPAAANAVPDLASRETTQLCVILDRMNATLLAPATQTMATWWGSLAKTFNNGFRASYVLTRTVNRLQLLGAIRAILANRATDANQSAEMIYARIYEVKGLTERVKMALDPTYVPQRAYKAGAAALGGVRTAVTSAGGFLGRAAAATRKAATKAMYKRSNGQPWNNANFNASGATGTAKQLRGTAISAGAGAGVGAPGGAAAAMAAMGPPQPFTQSPLGRTRRRNHTRKGRKAGRR